MIRRALTPALVFVALLTAAPAGAAVQVSTPQTTPLPSATSILRTMLAAPALIDYEGTKVISTVRGTRAETVTVLEAYKRLGRLRLEFLSPDSVSGRLIVDDGMSTWQYEPALHLVIQGPSFVQGTAHPERADAILRGYAVSVQGREEVVGRDAIVVALAAGAAGSNRRLWVDEATGVVLRTEERDETGEIVYVSFFSRISYSLNLPAALFQFRRPAGARALSFRVSGEPVSSADALRTAARAPVIAPPMLLGRFAFQSGRVSRVGAFSAAEVTYSDSVSAVTVFQTPSSRMAFPQVGEVIALRTGTGRFLDLGYFRVLLWQARGMNFALVANLPRAQMRAIVEELTGTR